MTDRIDVTFPVTIRLDLEVAREGSALAKLRADIEKLIEYAALPEPGLIDEAYRRPVALYTPPDDGAGSFAVVVRKPTVDLNDFDYALDHGEAATEAKVREQAGLDMLSGTDPYIRIQNALSDEQREAILRNFPHMAGAHVADILAEADNSDALIWIVEPFFERQRPHFVQPALVASAIRALYWAAVEHENLVRRVPSDDDVVELVGRA